MSWLKSGGGAKKKEDEIDLENIEKELQTVIKDI